MNQALHLIEKAIELGQQELAHLQAGELDKAEALAFGRDGLIDEALGHDDMDDGSLTECTDQSLDALVDKLMELKTLQARIIDEAKRLQDSIRDELKRNDQEQKRHKGYGNAARPPRRIQSMFISRNS